MNSLGLKIDDLVDIKAETKILFANNSLQLMLDLLFIGALLSFLLDQLIGLAEQLTSKLIDTLVPQLCYFRVNTNHSTFVHVNTFVVILIVFVWGLACVAG